MQGYAELLHSGELGELRPEQEQAMFVIVNRASEMKKMVERIGVLMAAQSRQLLPLPVTLADLAAEIVLERQEPAAKAGLRLELETEPDLPQIQGDPAQLRPAIDCLVENALKFTPRGGHVQVKLYHETNHLCLKISDTGIGITEDKLNHLFDGFYQADGSTTRRYGGLGLGLTVVKAVVEAHEGRLDVQSKLGAGSIFTARFPLPTTPTQALQPSAVENIRRILVVDDEESITMILQDGLERLPNCEILTAANGEEALHLFQQQAFDMLITDYKMPGTDGMTLAARVRQLYPNTAIMMLTAYSSDELREQAAQVSIRRILDKPIKLDQVRSAVKEELG
jgi:CheY-like chemotaxis protein